MFCAHATTVIRYINSNLSSHHVLPHVITKKLNTKKRLKLKKDQKVARATFKSQGLDRNDKCNKVVCQVERKVCLLKHLINYNYLH